MDTAQVIKDFTEWTGGFSPAEAQDRIKEYVETAMPSDLVPNDVYVTLNLAASLTKPCWDCGSTIKGHHTPLCEMAEEGSIRDLPQQEGTQWWTKEIPSHLA